MSFRSWPLMLSCHQPFLCCYKVRAARATTSIAPTGDPTAMSAEPDDALFRGKPPQHAGYVAICLGFGAGFSWEMAMITLWSFSKAAIEKASVPTSLVVLTDTPQLLERHRAAIPSLRVQTYNLTVLRKVERIERTLAPPDAGWFRFPLQATYVQRFCRDAELVLLFDLKDVLFQSSPFALAPRSNNGRPLDTLTSFTEMWQLRRGSWNHKKMAPFNRSYPQLINRIIDQKPLGLNDGLLMGPPRVVTRYVRELSSGVLGLKPAPAQLEGLDQGLHNILVYKTKLPMNQREGGPREESASTAVPPHTIIAMNLQGNCPVLTMHMIDPNIYSCDSVDRAVPGSSIFRLRSVASGEPFVMVHQWNRAPETVQRAVLCHHRHLLSMSKLRCGPTTSCAPWKPEKLLVQPDEREVLQKFAYPRSWRGWCPGKKCITEDTDKIGLL